MNMISAVLMNNSSDNNVVDKSITSVSTISCALKDPTEIIDPVLVIAGDIITSDINYVYIQAFERYYFIRNKRQVNATHVEVDLHVDVLMSFKNEIRASSALIEVTGNAVNPYIESEIWTPDVRRTTHVKNFSGGFNSNPEYILLTAGGAAN